MQWESASLSDPGRVRRQNEDALLVRAGGGVFAVADGMGGHAAGEVASRLAIETLAARADETGAAMAVTDLVAVFDDANRAILERAAADPATRGMGTTLSVLTAGSEGPALVAHIGDSRIYRWRGGRLEQLTRDHTWVQEHVDAGVLAPDRARSHPFSSVLTRVLGTTDNPAPDIQRLEVLPEDLYLLCSDGLTGMIDTGILAEVLAGDGSLEDKARALVAAANRAGGGDNITVILARARREG
jgi:protein phosphatase